MPHTTAHDGDEIYYEVHGAGPAVLLSVGPELSPEGPAAAHAKVLADAFSDRYTAVVFGYPGMTPKPETLTPDNVTADLLTIADAADVERFAWWGYSWGGVIGLQLALATDRLTALVMGGFPPIDGPCEAMLRVTRHFASDAGSVSGHRDPAGRPFARQFVTYYELLQTFDDRAAQTKVTCPKLVYVGTDDKHDLNGEVVAHFGKTVRDTQAELEATGWEVQIFPGKNHGDFTDEEVVTILAPLFDRHLSAQHRP